MSTTGSGGTSGDYSYDMAHEDVLPQEDAPPAPEGGEAPGTGTPDTGTDTGGDLSYDLAHEVPGTDG